MSWILNGTTNSIEWKCRAVIERTDYSITNNQSTIRVSFQWTRARSSSYGSNGATSYNITADGQSKSGSKDPYNHSYIGVDDWKDIGAQWFDVVHNADGSKGVSISCRWTQGVQPLECNVSGSFPLPTIPRASSVTCNDGNIGSATTINISRASSSFTHTIKYKFSDLTGTIATKTSNTSIGWVIPTSFYSKIPNSKAGAFEIICETYNGNTLIGTKTYSANCFVVNSEPTATAIFEDITPTTIALTGDKNKIIAGVSTVRVRTTATAMNSATIKSIVVKCSDGKSKTGADIELNWIVEANFTVIVTDSRGFATVINKTMTLIEYIEPAITEVNINRVETTAPLTQISVKGVYWGGSFGAVQNTRALTYYWRKSGTTTWSNPITLAPTTLTGNALSYTANLTQPFDVNYDYDFIVRLQDKIRIFDKSFVMGKSIPLVKLYKEKMDVNGEIFSHGRNIVDSGKNSNGKYIKYSDGTMICTNTVSFMATLNKPKGTLFSSEYGSLLGDFPATFAGTTEDVYITGCITSGGSSYAFNSQLYNHNTTNAGAVFLFGYENTASKTYKFTYTAIGRWK